MKIKRKRSFPDPEVLKNLFDFHDNIVTPISRVTMYELNFSELNKVSMTQSLYLNNSDIFNINNFINDGFNKICDVLPSTEGNWIYKNINTNLMYLDHRSWIYFIVVNNDIVKCGETSQPLGLPGRREVAGERQPRTGTKSRFGRLANEKNCRHRVNDTDHVLRESIDKLYQTGCKISLWARQCPIVQSSPIIVLGNLQKPLTTIHKDLELTYLNFFKSNGNMLPMFNKSTK